MKHLYAIRLLEIAIAENKLAIKLLKQSDSELVSDEEFKISEIAERKKYIEQIIESIKKLV